MTRVLVLGAGFGGIATAVALRAQLRPADEVVLVDRHDDFVMGLRKTWAILGISPIAYGTRSLPSLRRSGITFVQGEIEEIDPTARTARVDGVTYDADALVVALGAARALDSVPGLAEHGLSAWDHTGLDHVHGMVDGFRGGRVVVGIFGAPYSCPPAPFELAMLLSERLLARGIEAQISLFGPAPIVLPILGAAGCAVIDGSLAERGIEYLGGTTAAEVTSDAVLLADGSRLPFDLLLAVPPHRCPGLLVEAGLAPAGGWVKVDPRTLETGHPDVYALGDATAIILANGLPLPKAGLFAEREGEVIASRIAAKVLGGEPSATFDGRGACFIEVGNGEAATIRGDFFADPPEVTLSEPSAQQRADKERFELDRLERWFGG